MKTANKPPGQAGPGASTWSGRPARRAVVELPANANPLDTRIAALCATVGRLFSISRENVATKKGEALDIHIFTAPIEAKKSLPDMDAKLFAFRHCAGLIQMLSRTDKTTSTEI